MLDMWVVNMLIEECHKEGEDTILSEKSQCIRDSGKSKKVDIDTFLGKKPRKSRSQPYGNYK